MTRNAGNWNGIIIPKYRTVQVCDLLRYQFEEKKRQKWAEISADSEMQRIEVPISITGWQLGIRNAINQPQVWVTPGMLQILWSKEV